MRRLALEAMGILIGPEVASAPSESELSGFEDADNVVEYTSQTDDAVFRAYVRKIGTVERQSLYLVCSAEIQRPASLEARRSRLEESLHTLGRGTQRHEPVYVTVHMRLPGVRTGVQSEQETGKVLARLRAQRVDEFGSESWYSVLLHSPLLGPAVEVAGRQVNLSLVFRQDVDAGCTWVTIGSPLCAGDY
jgi:hypothetical protein